MKKSVAILVALAAALPACDSESESQATSNVTASKETRIQALFESLVDGVQLIESADDVGKQNSAVDETTAPPSYEVSYAGCLDGFVSGTFCVEQGQHRVNIVGDNIHIIRSVDQRYVLKQFGSIPDFVMTGALESHVEVAVDTTTETTQIEGQASGSLDVVGDINGTVTVDLNITGGRTYTEATATPVIIVGTLTHDGVSYPVDGGFQRP